MRHKILVLVGVIFSIAVLCALFSLVMIIQA